MLTYAYTLTPDSNGTYLIQYPDLPEGAAVSETEKAGPDAAEGLDAVLQLYIDARRPIPMPTDVGDGSVSLGAMRTAKVLLANEMVRQGVRKADLARRLGVHAPRSTACWNWATTPRWMPSRRPATSWASALMSRWPDPLRDCY